MKRKKLLGAVVCLIAVCAVVGVLAACGEKGPDRTEIPLSEWDLYLLEQHKPLREPSVDDDFEDNKVRVILRSAYDDLREIGFQEFSVVDDVAEIVSIKYCYNYPYVTITKRTETLKLPSTKSNHLFYLELDMHDKAKVFEACDALKQLDMVLIAEPVYRRYVEYDWVPSDTYYDEQWALI